MTSVKNHIWVSTTNGLWIIDRKTMDARLQNMTDKRFTSLLFDPKENCIYLGGADGFGISHPRYTNHTPTGTPDPVDCLIH